MAMARGRSVKRYEDGNYVSPCARVIEINGKAVEAWIYRGGHRDRPILELVSRNGLAERLSVRDGDAVTILIREVPEGTPGMPGPPPARPGRTEQMA
jgi:CTP-dependent riboflavin kinase